MLSEPPRRNPCPRIFDARGAAPGAADPQPRGRGALHPIALGVLVLVVFAAVGCGTSHGGRLDVDRLADELRDRGIDPRRVVLPYGLTDEMRQFARETAPRHLGELQRLQYLRDRLLDADEMKIEYSWGYTGTAAEVFRQRKANCLAFTNLFLGMAREVGVQVHFVSIENVETFRREGDLVVISDHIAVSFGEGPSRKIFDFSENPSVDRRVSRRVSDLEAIAMFHSNRGAEALQAGAVDSAVEWLELAVAIDPELPTAWVNYGVALRRAGLTSSAEDAYKQAIAVDPRSYSAYHNLAALLRSKGREEEAVAYEATLARAPSQNPYTYLSLGDLSLKAGQLEDAERYYRRAVSLAPDDAADCYAALGQLAMVNGNLRLARRMLRKAERAGAASPRAQMLAEALLRHQRQL